MAAEPEAAQSERDLSMCAYGHDEPVPAVAVLPYEDAPDLLLPVCEECLECAV